MIYFRSIKWKNLLSTGNTFTEIDLCGKPTTLIVGSNGAGKAQPLYSKVLTPHGWKTMGEIKVGDKVLTPTGMIQNVIEIPFEGEEDVYEITFVDGRTVRCGLNHLWRIWGLFDNVWQWKVLSLKDIIESPEKKIAFSNNKYVELFSPKLEDNNTNLSIDPYLLGVLIGDGSFTGSSVTLTNMDEELVNRVSYILEETTPRIIKLNLTKTSKNNNKHGYRINYGMRYEKHGFREELKKMGLHGKRSYDKFIPDEYKYASFNQRMELIRGLMDTDGTCGKNGTISFVTTSYQLAKDLQEILFSIGAICKISNKQTFYIHKGEKRKGRPSYQLNIRYKTPSDLFFLTRKKERCLNYQYKDSLRLKINKIEKIGSELTKCITVSNEDGLYVTDNYVVTHNSTLLDAISFGMFGKPFRKINKPQLLNSINQKNLIVEVEFSIGSVDYKIIRGMKPNIFEVYQNGNLLNQSAESKDYQEILETQILKVNHKSFCQVVILGSATFQPFMQLPAAQRREIIEDLLDLQIFTTMNSILKDKITENKESLESIVSDRRVIESKIEMTKDHMQELQINNDKLIEEKKFLIIDTESKIQEFDSKLKELIKVNTKLKTNIVDREKINKNLTDLSNLRNEINFKLDKLNKEVKFYNKNTKCPTCKQNIDEDFRQTAIESNQNEISKIEDGIEKLQIKYEKLNNRLKEIIKLESEIHQNEINIIETKTTIRSLTSYINQLNEDIEKISNIHLEQSDNKLIEYENELKKIEVNFNELTEDKTVLSAASVLLKDNGIKSKIIKQYIPVINRLINKYLAAMDFFVSFELDEQFNETIKSRYRDEFSYASFSEGEKQKIDLALLFTWRAIAKLRNSINTNLLILDETFDSSLDQNGTEYLISILYDVAKDCNIFIISHKETLSEKFTNVLRFSKIKNFSAIQE